MRKKKNEERTGIEENNQMRYNNIMKCNNIMKKKYCLYIYKCKDQDKDFFSSGGSNDKLMNQI